MLSDQSKSWTEEILIQQNFQIFYILNKVKYFLY